MQLENLRMFLWGSGPVILGASINETDQGQQ